MDQFNSGSVLTVSLQNTTFSVSSRSLSWLVSYWNVLDRPSTCCHKRNTTVRSTTKMIECDLSNSSIMNDLEWPQLLRAIISRLIGLLRIAVTKLQVVGLTEYKNSKRKMQLQKKAKRGTKQLQNRTRFQVNRTCCIVTETQSKVTCGHTTRYILCIVFSFIVIVIRYRKPPPLRTYLMDPQDKWHVSDCHSLPRGLAGPHCHGSRWRELFARAVRTLIVEDIITNVTRPVATWTDATHESPAIWRCDCQFTRNDSTCNASARDYLNPRPATAHYGIGIWSGAGLSITCGSHRSSRYSPSYQIVLVSKMHISH